MKRDIRINFSMLDGIGSKTYTYMNALEKMKSSLKKIYDSLESENSGKSIDALKKLYMVLEKQIDQCYREVKDINDIFRGYIEEMQGIIAPKNYDQMMQVDRDDISRNIASIAGSIGVLELLKYDRETYRSFSSLDDIDEEIIENQIANGRKLEEIGRIIDSYKNRLHDCMDDMNSLYKNKVVTYEDKDDEYASKAKKLYDKYTNTWERICDRTSSIDRSINDFLEGIISSIVDMVKGLVGLAIGILTYIPAGIGLAVTKVTGDTPDFLEGCMVKTKGYNEMIGAILNDPALMVEGLGQNISDAWEEKGVAYCTGYATGEVLQAVVLKKIKLSKLNKVDDVSVISKSKIIIKGKNINVAEILAGLRVSNKNVTSIISKVSIEDLKKLYIYLEKNPDSLETHRVIDKILKGDSVDDVIKGVSNAKGGSYSADYKYWKNSTEFNGTKVYQRNDLIDPNLVDARGRSNLQRMEKGLAPIGPDGNPINLHHLTQKNTCSIAEVTQTFHQQNTKIIHINSNQVPSAIDRNAFASWKRNYWKSRVNDFN